MGRTDGEVIASSIADPMRFATIFDRHAVAVRRFAARRLGAASADDTVAETFRIAFERRADFDRSANTALPWLYGIAGNLVRRQHRDHHRWLTALGRSTGQRQLVADPLLEVGDRLDAERQRSALIDAVLDLVQGEREVLLLVAWEQVTPAEAAEALGIPAATARTRLHRARMHVRAALANADGEHTEVRSDAS